jgi:hypothetical protein
MADTSGPDIELGFVKVVAAGTPVNIMYNVDPTLAEAPETSNRTGGKLFPPYRFQQIMFRAMKPAAHGMEDNTGNIYILRASGTRDTPDLMVAILKKGETLFLASSPRVGDTFNPYRYYIDADSNDDGALITGLTQG